MSSAAATNASAGAGPVKPLIVVVENKAEDFEDDWTEAAEFHPSNLNFNIHPTWMWRTRTLKFTFALCPESPLDEFYPIGLSGFWQWVFKVTKDTRCIVYWDKVISVLYLTQVLWLRWLSTSRRFYRDLHFTPTYLFLPPDLMMSEKTIWIHQKQDLLDVGPVQRGWAGRRRSWGAQPVPDIMMPGINGTLQYYRFIIMLLQAEWWYCCQVWTQFWKWSRVEKQIILRRYLRFSWPSRRTTRDWRKTPWLLYRGSRGQGRRLRAKGWTSGTSSLTPVSWGFLIWPAIPSCVAPAVNFSTKRMMASKRHNIIAKNLNCWILLRLRADKDL